MVVVAVAVGGRGGGKLPVKLPDELPPIFVDAYHSLPPPSPTPSLTRPRPQEQLLLAAAIIVCLMGLMYSSLDYGGIGGNIAQSRDAVTSVVLAVVILAIVYFFVVVFTEIVVLWNEESTRKKIARLRAKGTSKSGDLDRELRDRKSKGLGGKGGVSRRDTAVVGATDTEFNPLFINAGANGEAGAPGEAPPASLLDAVASASRPPPQELWTAFQQAYMAMSKQLESVNERLVAAQMAEAGGAGGFAASGKFRAEFNPTTAAGHGGGGGGMPAVGSPTMRAPSGAMAAAMSGADGDVSAENPLADARRSAGPGGLAGYASASRRSVLR